MKNQETKFTAEEMNTIKNAVESFASDGRFDDVNYVNFDEHDEIINQHVTLWADGDPALSEAICDAITAHVENVEVARLRDDVIEDLSCAVESDSNEFTAEYVAAHLDGRIDFCARDEWVDGRAKGVVFETPKFLFWYV